MPSFKRLLPFRRKEREKKEEKPKPTPPPGKPLEINKFGAITLLDGHIHVSTYKTDTWGPLSPLAHSRRINEIFVTPQTDVRVTLESGKRLPAHLRLSKEEIVGIMNNVVAETGVKLNWRTKRAVAELDDWRVFMQVETGGGIALVMTRVQKIPRLEEIVDRLLAARLLALLLSPFSVVVYGLHGTGKTTLINSIVNAVNKVFPHLHVTTIEGVKEIRRNWGVSIVEENLGKAVLDTAWVTRPDVLVIGEIQLQDVYTFVEAGRRGATITSFHSPNIDKLLSSLALGLKKALGEVQLQDVLSMLDVFVGLKKIHTEDSITRIVDEVYLSNGQKLIPIYALENGHLDEDQFWKLIPERTYVGDRNELRKVLYTFFNVNPEEYSFFSV